MVVSAGRGVRVVHLVPPGGGGVDRCVRDIVQLRPHDLIVHASDSQWVLEWPGERHFAPLAPDDLVRQAATGALGAPLLLHAHSTVPAIRQACARLTQATGAATLLTLHDIWFSDPTLDADERRQRLDFVRAAAARTAPSHFILDHARRALGDDLACRWIPNGADPFAPTAEGVLSDPAREALGGLPMPVAVIGAIGEHKGLTALERVAALLPPGQRIVVFGYTERQLRQGWALEGRLWVHGMFEPAQLPALARAYGVRMAFFPPGMPESYCYALTDAWMSGLTVLAPDHGAIGERVHGHGGGSLYDVQATPAFIAEAIGAHLAQARRNDGPVALHHPVPSMSAMMNAMNDLYQSLQSTLPPRIAQDEPLRRLAQTHLDARYMRLEVLHLQAAAEGTARTMAELRQQLDAAQARLDALAAERDQWQQRHQALVGRLARPLRWLPAALRAPLARWGRRLLGLQPDR